MSFEIILFIVAIIVVIIAAKYLQKARGVQDGDHKILSGAINLGLYSAALLLLFMVMSCFPPPPSGWQDAWLAKALAWYPVLIAGFLCRAASVWAKGKAEVAKFEAFKTWSYVAPGLAIGIGLVTAYFMSPTNPWYKGLSGYDVEQGRVLANAWLAWLRSMEAKPLPLFLVAGTALVGLVFGKSRDYSNLGLALSSLGEPLAVYLGGTALVGFLIFVASKISCWISYQFGRGTLTADHCWFSEWLAWWVFWALGLVALLALYVKAYEGGTSKARDRAGFLVFLFPALGVIFGFLGGYNWVEWTNSPALGWFYRVQNPWEYYTDTWAWWFANL